jgi:hypothetical protein
VIVGNGLCSHLVSQICLESQHHLPWTGRQIEPGTHCLCSSIQLGCCRTAQLPLVAKSRSLFLEPLVRYIVNGCNFSSRRHKLVILRHFSVRKVREPSKAYQLLSFKFRSFKYILCIFKLKIFFLENLIGAACFGVCCRRSSAIFCASLAICCVSLAER